MKEVRLPQFYEQAESVWKKFLQALPVIAFFLILFYSVIYLFGMQYTMIVSLVTVVFQVNYKKRNIPAGALTKLLVQQIFLLCLAYTATWNIILSLLLNLVVPFWLIFTTASQFNQLGYFSTLMTFTFMQFIPAGRSGFITQFEAMVFCCIFVFITIRLYQYIKLLTEAEKENDIFHRHIANFFRMFLFILHQSEIKDRGILSEQWEVPPKHRFREKILARFRPDTFEMRFALRMSVVLMAGMTFNLLSKDSHSYWFVMNAFLLLRPMYEDSNYRMRTRFLGTAAGCVIVALILPFCNTMSSHLILAGIMVTCMYTATPGTIIHALFVTCFALSMTTLAIGETMAVFLRVAYIVSAVLFVLVINRFFFPTSLVSQVRYNLQLLFHMHHMYLRMLEDSLTNQLDYWRICDAQIQYHTALAQIRNDLPKVEKDEKDRSYYNRILNITWCMASEIQQMFFQIKHKKRGAEARKIMEQYILYTDYVLNQIQEMLHLKKEKKLKNIEEMKYQRYIEGEPELSSLMTQYARNLSRLYVLVLRRVRNEY